jgi:site-specific DNA-methyltransferase (adenine-specific)
MSITLNLGDCLEAMRAMPDNAYDLAIVDPPYGIGNWVQQTGNVRGKAVDWNDSIPSKDYFQQLKRVSREQIIWGANYYNCFEKGGAIVWNKHVKRETNLSVCEIASYSRLQRVDYVDLIWQNLNRKEQTIHPCQKPVKLYEWLLDNYAKEGDRILDTHLGSGSIAIACHNRGFTLDSWEIDAEYHAAAVKRFEQHRAQLTIF